MMRSQKTKVPEGQFDPEELTYRLKAVLAEQKAHEERRRRAAAREAEAAGKESSRNRDKSARHNRQDTYSATNSTDTTNPRQSKTSGHKSSNLTVTTSNPNASSTTTNFSNGGEYHHVPQEAAKQFARTATAQQMRNNDFVHQLHRRAFTNSQSHQKSDSQPPSDVARHPKQSQHQRDKSSGEKQHTFQAEFFRFQRRHSLPATVDPLAHAETQPANRRNSTMALESHLTHSAIPEDSASSTSPRLSPVEAANEHRAVDWTQSDEARHRAGQRANGQSSAAAAAAVGTKQAEVKPSKQKLLLSPLIKRADSIWGLRGRHRGGEEGERGEKEVKSPKEGHGGGFFARFKR